MVDLSFLEKFTKGDKAKMKRYISIYLSVAPDTFKKMAQNIIDQDREQLRINAHSLKPQVEYMGILPLKTILINIEKDAKNGGSEVLRSLYEKALQLHLESEVILKDFIEKL